MYPEISFTQRAKVKSAWCQFLMSVPAPTRHYQTRGTWWHMTQAVRSQFHSAAEWFYSLQLSPEKDAVENSMPQWDQGGGQESLTAAFCGIEILLQESGATAPLSSLLLPCSGKDCRGYSAQIWSRLQLIKPCLQGPRGTFEVTRCSIYTS